MCDRRQTGVCPGASIFAGQALLSLVNVLVWPKLGRAAGQPGSLGREATAGAVSRRESTRHVRDRSCGTVGRDALVAGQEPERHVGETAVVITGRSGRVRASSGSLLVVGSNTVRTCVQGFGPLWDARRSVTCGDGDLRVQEHRSAAERGSVCRCPCAARWRVVP